MAVNMGMFSNHAKDVLVLANECKVKQSVFAFGELAKEIQNTINSGTVTGQDVASLNTVLKRTSGYISDTLVNKCSLKVSKDE